MAVRNEFTFKKRQKELAKKKKKEEKLQRKMEKQNAADKNIEKNEDEAGPEMNQPQ